MSVLRTVPNPECSMDVSYYDSPPESLNVPDTGETKKKKKPLLIEQALMDIYNFIDNNHQAK